MLRTDFGHTLPIGRNDFVESEERFWQKTPVIQISGFLWAHAQVKSQRGRHRCAMSNEPDVSFRRCCGRGVGSEVRTVGREKT